MVKGDDFVPTQPLLQPMEDCKQEAGITAPIGMVVSAHVSAPAILGWLRPRILLPSLISSLSRAQFVRIRSTNSTFRSLDILLYNWLFYPRSRHSLV